jgi:hypothetical protein
MVASQQISEKYGCFATKMMKSMVAAQQSVCETNKQSVDVSFFINGPLHQNFLETFLLIQIIKIILEMFKK